jgi:ribonuclease-3
MDLGSGKGYSKKESHQKAAKKAIKKLRNDNELLETLLTLNKTAFAETSEPADESLSVENTTE